MTPSSAMEFIFPASFSIDAFLQRLTRAWPFQEKTETTGRRTCFDSFDWRLYARGYTLGIDSSGRETWLILRQEGGTETRRRLPGPTPPRFAWDLPEGDLRTILSPILELRALLPVVEIQYRRWHLKWLNKDRKTVLRLEVEQNLAVAGDDGPHPLPGRVRILPVKGYRKAEKRIGRFLGNEPELSPAGEREWLTRALAALGRRPLDYSSKFSLRLKPGMRSDLAARSILRHLLATMKTNEPGLRADIDSEFLHDFRVAVRRTRTALSQFKKAFPAPAGERFGVEFAWLGRVTGEARDLDVFLLNFEHYKASLPPAMRNDLAPFHGFLQKHRKQAHERLLHALDSDRYRNLMADWDAFLNQPLPDHPDASHALLPIERLARRRIRRVYRGILRKGRAITPESPAEALHDLRKQCKKLRYLLEFFQSLFPQEQIKGLIRILKRLQDNLGEFQDTEVQQRRLREFSREMIREGDAGADTLLAMGVLIQNLEHRRNQARKAFARCFARFDNRKHRKRFKTLFAKPRPEEEENT